MSRIVGVDEVSASSYIVLASEMSVRLANIADSGEIRGDEVKRGIYYGALEFFDEIMLEIREEISSIRTRRLRSIALQSLERAQGRSIEEKTIREHFERYDSFMRNLEARRCLNEKDIETARSLSSFFRSLYERGEEDFYDDFVRGFDDGDDDV